MAFQIIQTKKGPRCISTHVPRGLVPTAKCSKKAGRVRAAAVIRGQKVGKPFRIWTPKGFRCQQKLDRNRRTLVLNTHCGIAKGSAGSGWKSKGGGGGSRRSGGGGGHHHGGGGARWVTTANGRLQCRSSKNKLLKHSSCKGKKPSGVKGFFGLDDNFVAVLGDTPVPGNLPRTCKRFDTIHSEAFDHDVKVCTELGDPMQITQIHGSDLNGAPVDGALAGPLAKYYGLAQVGGGLGPSAGVLLGGGVAAVASAIAPMIPVIKGLPYNNLLTAAALGGLATLHPITRSAGYGALFFTGGLVVYGLVKNVMSRSGVVKGLGAIVPERFNGLGAIVPERGFQAYRNVDVLAGGDNEIDVLAGSFGGLPFAGAF